MAELPPTDTPSLLARLPGVTALALTIVAKADLSPAIIELELAGPLEGLVAAPGNDLMLAVPVEGGDGSFRRRYSIRSIDAHTGRLRLWIDRAAGGPGARWAATAELGTTIEAIGPRGKVTLDTLAGWHLFIGDLSFLSAAYNMAEAIEPPGQALFVIEADERSHLPIPALADGIGVTMGIIERHGRGLDDPTGLLAGLAAIDFPEDDGHVYVGGELQVVAAVRRSLIERGITAEQISSKPYWRLGTSNLAHGEPQKS